MEKPTVAEVKLTIAKLIEVAYSQDKGMTTRIVMEKGPFRLAVDENGQAELTGKTGIVRFSGGTALKKVGIAFKRMTVNFSGGENGDVNYTAGVSIVGGVGMAVNGSFNVVDLITSCSGLLCQAARHLKSGNLAVDTEMQRIMGH